jgi:hypothetical protein
MKIIKRETVADYLTYLEQRGIEKGYFELHEIRNIGSTCCLNATTQVIDFDKTKDKMVAANKWKTIKSCDCLKIRPNKQCIDLIEMKSFKQIIDNFFRDKKNIGMKIDEVIDDKVVNFNLVKKIENSMLVLDNITIKQEFDQTLQDAKFYRETKINYILLTDVDSMSNGKNYFNFAMYFLATHSNSPEKYITSKLESELDSIPNISHKLNKPMLKTCSEIDAYYAQ